MKNLVAALLLLGTLPSQALACDDGQFVNKGKCYDSLAEIPGRTRGTVQDIPTKIVDRVKAACTRDFPDDFSVRLGCMDLQFDAYKKLRDSGALSASER